MKRFVESLIFYDQDDPPGGDLSSSSETDSRQPSIVATEVLMDLVEKAVSEGGDVLEAMAEAYGQLSEENQRNIRDFWDRQRTYARQHEP